MKTACTSRVRAKQIGGDVMLDLFLLPNEPSKTNDWQWLSVRGYASIIPWNIFPVCHCVGGLGWACPSKKDRRAPLPSFADLSDLDQITVYREACCIIRCSPLFICKLRLFNMQVSTTINGYFEEGQMRGNAFGTPLSKFQLGILQGLCAKSQENNACWQIGWIVIKAPATLRTWNRHHLAVHKVTCFVLSTEDVPKYAFNHTHADNSIFFLCMKICIYQLQLFP